MVINTFTLGSLMFKYPNCLTKLLLDKPDTGYFNHVNGAFYLYQVPARQWRRGLCSANHEIYNPLRNFIHVSGLYTPRLTLRTVNCLFSNKRIESDFNKALQKLKENEECTSVAVSHNLMFSKSPTSDLKYPLLWFKAYPVGYVMPDHFVIQDSMFEQEVEDEVYRLGKHEWIF